MKRSEMLTIIHDAIESCYQKPVVIPDYVLQAVLEAIEEAGMLPPPIETEFWNRQDNNYHMANEWEPEVENAKSNT